MKYFLKIAIIIYLILPLPCMVISQTSGFIEDECVIVDNPAYSFYNYQVGNHGSGYKLVHNGIVIDQQEDPSFQYYHAEELRFIDSITGYFITTTGSGFYSVFKILDDSVTLLGQVTGVLYDFFVVSRHTIYFISNFGWPQQLFASRLSDIQPQRDFVSNLNFNADTTVFDTITGLPLCSGLHELNYFYKTDQDSLIFTISLAVDTPMMVINKMKRFRIFPNPFKANLHIQSTSENSDYNARIVDNMGRTVISFRFDGRREDAEFDLHELKPGFYTLQIFNSNYSGVYKIIKI